MYEALKPLFSLSAIFEEIYILQINCETPPFSVSVLSLNNRTIHTWGTNSPFDTFAPLLFQCAFNLQHGVG